MTLSSTHIRRQFIDYFVKERAHTFVPSSPVVPHEDPTLLFTNAGMNQFKPIFLGQTAPGSEMAKLKRAANSQKCIRAGGKHNDLDDVGKDLYHHTFFEMLGNWSFGDYFKAEAIEWAWDLLTRVWKLDPDRLYATYFEGSKDEGLEPDREAYDLWRRFLPAQRILPGNMKDNFWEMGDTGPCGPCSEIHFDGRPDSQRATEPGYNRVNRSDPDVIEVWNLVFIQYNRTAPGGAGLKPLPAKHVDTGMGFERITRVIQGKASNYDTDVFTPYFTRIREICNAPAYSGSLTEPRDIAYRVLADHIRTLTFAITDGAEPSNEGRGYVLRRILRRAVKYGHQNLGARGGFLHQLVPTVVETMGEFFPELRKNPQRVMDVIRDEEESFGRTLERGIALFETAAREAYDSFAKSTSRTTKKPLVSAEDAFKLHDTYGFPIDLTQIMAEERGMTVDVEGFHRLMEEARERARSGGGATGEAAHPALTLPGDAVARLQRLNIKPTDDQPKFTLKQTRATIRAIWNGSDFDESAETAGVRPTDRLGLILDRTNFYAEMGGQVGDSGRIAVSRESRSSVRSAGNPGEFRAEETRVYGGYVLHFGRLVKGEIRVGDDVVCELEKPRRQAVMANHTGTHLLNFALREVLGEGVDQKGSLVAPDRLRFDFSASAPIAPEQTERIESIVRSQISLDLPVCADTAPLPLAKRINGLRAVFGEAYPDPVRIVSIGAPIGALLQSPDSSDWRRLSIELCGGTHVESTSQIGGFAIIEESAVAKGVRRIVALTGAAAGDSLSRAESLASRAEAAGAKPDDALEAEIAAIQHELTQIVLPVAQRRGISARLESLHDRVKAAKKKSAAAGRDAAVDLARRIADEHTGRIIVAQIDGAGLEREALLSALDSVRSRRTDSAVMLLAPDAESGKVTIVANVPKPLIDKGLKAGDWVREAAQACGGKGGGRPDSAQGGGTDVAKTPAAADAARRYAESRLGA